MSDSNGKVQEVKLDENSDAIVAYGGITVKFNTGGRVDIHGDVPVALHTANACPRPQVEQTAKPNAKNILQIGAKMEDGTIYAGMSPNTNKPMYTTPSDAPLPMDWDQARNYAANLDAHGHGDWRLPTKEELAVLFNYRAFIGAFKEKDPIPRTNYYWTSVPEKRRDGKRGDYAWSARTWDGLPDFGPKTQSYSVRCVR